MLCSFLSVGSEIGEDCNLTKFFCSHVDEVKYIYVSIQEIFLSHCLTIYICTQKSNTHVGYRVLHEDNYFTPDKILSLCTDLLIR